MHTPTILLSAHGVTKYYPVSSRRGAAVVRAVDGVSLEIFRGETFGIVGESGCGKSTLGRVLLRLEELTSGEVSYDGRNLTALDRAEIKRFRKKAQIIYQDPFSALNPKKRIGALIAEPLIIHKIGDKKARTRRVAELLEKVGLRPAYMDRYPHEFSGGQRQRIVIARALALGPTFILADEPVSALDVSIQAQIINLLMDLQEEADLTFLLISHSLPVVEYLCDRLAVMYLGRIVETAPKDAFFTVQCHPYAKALLEAVPVMDPAAAMDAAILPGEVPSPINPPSGCHFHPRCPRRKEKCRSISPALRPIAPDRQVACHYPYGLDVISRGSK
jgi:oligopeptide/dipeptide ABC transporter ATP-binding protein